MATLYLLGQSKEYVSEQIAMIYKAPGRICDEAQNRLVTKFYKQFSNWRFPSKSTSLKTGNLVRSVFSK